MEIFEELYCKHTSFCLKMIGLWPSQTFLTRRLGCIAFCALNFSLIIPQIIFFIRTEDARIEILVENFLVILFSLGSTVKYLILFSKCGKLRILYHQTVECWQSITDASEERDLTEILKIGRRVGMLYSVYIFDVAVALSVLPLIPTLMNFIAPLENSHRKWDVGHSDYMLPNQDDYRWATCIHTDLVILSNMILTIGIDTLLVTLTRLICGIFLITSNRVQMITHDTRDSSKSYQEIKQSDLKSVVFLHDKSLRYCYFLEDIFNNIFLIIEAVLVIMMATIYFYVVRLPAPFTKKLIYFVTSVGMNLHLLFLNWIGQSVIDYSGTVFESACSHPWYATSPKGNRCLLLVMQRSLRPSTLTAGKMLTLSMVSLAQLNKASMSYFTALLSIEREDDS